VPQPVARNVTEAMIQVAPSAGIAPAGRVVAGKTGTVQHPTQTGQNKDAWMVGYTPSVSTAVWVGTDQSDPIKDRNRRPVYGRMLPGAIWKTFMTGALSGTTAEQFSPFVPLGTPPGTATDESAGSDDDSDEKSDDDKDEDKDDDDSDSDSGDSDRGSDGSSDSNGSGSSGSGSDSGRSDSSNDSSSSGDDSSDENTAFEEPRIDVPGLRSSNDAVLRTSGQQPLAAGAG
jgi:membrane peptidoglycan carboxypeptidase